MSQMDWLCKAQQKLFARQECLLVVTTFWDTTFWKRYEINVILTFLLFFGSAYIFWAQQSVNCQVYAIVRSNVQRVLKKDFLCKYWSKTVMQAFCDSKGGYKKD